MSSSSEISRRKLLGGMALTAMGAAAASTFAVPTPAFAENPWEKPSILVFDVSASCLTSATV